MIPEMEDLLIAGIFTKVCVPIRGLSSSDQTSLKSRASLRRDEILNT
jgi:hypothetical protein